MRYYHIHAKLSMTKGSKGGEIELEAYDYAEAEDSEKAKEIMQQIVFSRFPELCYSKIKFFANEISVEAMELEGKIMFRSDKTKPFKQMTIDNYQGDDNDAED